MVEDTIGIRIEAIQERIATAARRVARDPAEVMLVAVSKGQSAEVVASAYAAGLRLFGENRVEEAAPKAQAVAALVAPATPPTWHMIGHLQSRKAGAVFPWARAVHSVDSVKLAVRLNGFAAGQPRLPILLQVNVSGEASKEGFDPADILQAAGEIVVLTGLQVEGIMTMAPIVADPEAARPVFARLREVRDQLAQRYPQCDWGHLSMGMTDDFEVAIEEGSTMVRIGRAVFGERPCALPGTAQ